MATFGRPLRVLALLAPLIVLLGCASGEWVTVREVPKNPLTGPLRLLSGAGPRPTERTEQFLRQADLEAVADLPPREMLARLQQHVSGEPTAQGMYTISELAYIAGLQARDGGEEALALDMFGASVAHAYMFLLDERFADSRNEYDPQYRRACDLYNGALEGALRIVAADGGIRPGHVLTVDTGQQTFDIKIDVRGRWQADEIERFEFASDYEVNGLANNFHTYGLGVPLIAVRATGASDATTEKFYPPGLTFPITAFLHVAARDPFAGGETPCNECDTVHSCVLAFYDPLQSTIIVDRRRGLPIPLESDLSVPLAYFLNQPAFRQDSARNLAYLGFLNPNAGREVQGLYMLEPYDPDKIPVVFVHGLASSPVTWTDMYNDLRAAPEIGQNYQFWFYFYPTGQPFWVSATQLRMDLANALRDLDPQREAPRLDQMVLVGHSMGGLLSKLQTIDSRDDYWRLVSDRSPEELQGDEEAKMALLTSLYFKPSPSVRRVVTIGTPHRGSNFANPLTRTFTRLVAEMPKRLIDAKWQLVRANPDFFEDTELITMDTGVDSLVPDSPFLPLMLESPRAPWVRYHNIVGLVDEDDDFLRRLADEKGDGVVSLASARIPDVESEVIVPAGHTSIHGHPKAIREVRRILREHLRRTREARQVQLATYGDDFPRPREPRRGYRFEDHYRPNRADGAATRIPRAGFENQSARP